MNLSRVILLLLVASLASPLQAKVYKIATISPDGLSWMKKLRAGTEEIAARTEGRVTFKIYPGGVQGDDRTVLRKMRIGQLQGGALAAGALTGFYPDLQIYNLPLVFMNYEEVDYVREVLDEQIVQGLERNGMISFGLTETGFAYILSNSPVHSVEELRAVKAWVPDNDSIAIELVKSFGVSPIPLNLADVLAALQTGLINAVAIPPIVAIALQWHTQVKYVTAMPLVYIYSMLVMDSDAFHKMDAQDQEVVRQVLGGIFAEIDRDNRKDNLTAYQALLEQGIVEVQPTAENLAEWIETAQLSINKLVESGSISSASMNKLVTRLEAFKQTGADQAQ